MKKTKNMAFLLYVASIALIGCGESGARSGGASPTAAPPAQTGTGTGAGAASPAAKQHDISGRVEAVSRERGMLTLDHEEIPGVMPAMKMEYAVADRTILDRVAVGILIALHGFRIEAAAGGLPGGAADAAMAGVLGGLLGAKLLYAAEHAGEEPVREMLFARRDELVRRVRIPK